MRNTREYDNWMIENEKIFSSYPNQLCYHQLPHKIKFLYELPWQWDDTNRRLQFYKTVKNVQSKFVTVFLRIYSCQNSRQNRENSYEATEPLTQHPQKLIVYAGIVTDNRM